MNLNLRRASAVYLAYNVHNWENFEWKEVSLPSPCSARLSYSSSPVLEEEQLRSLHQVVFISKTTTIIIKLCGFGFMMEFFQIVAFY